MFFIFFLLFIKDPDIKHLTRITKKGRIPQNHTKEFKQKQNFYYLIDNQKVIVHINEIDKIAYIGNGQATKKKYNYTDLNIPEQVFINNQNYKVTQISSKCFSDYQIDSIILPKTIEKLGKAAFHNSTLKSINMENTKITEIPFKCFSNCYFLTKILLPKGLLNISSKSFSFSSISDITFPSSLIHIGEKAFGFCINMKFVDLSSTQINRIEDYSFFSAMVKSIKLPKNVCYIGSYAFYKCPLSKFEFSQSLTTLSNSSFSLTLMQTIDLSETKLKILPPSCFSNCIILKTVKLPTYLETISIFCFCDCFSLSKLEFNNCLQYIEGFSFANTSLIELIFPESLLELCQSSFESCMKLESVDLSQTAIFEIGHSAFYNCNNLQKVIFPHSLKTIGQKAFCSTKLSNISIPNSLKKIESYAFMNTSLTSIDLSLTHILRIPSHCFARTLNLTKIILNDEILSFGSFAFYQTSLISIDLPKSLVLIGPSCFEQSLLESIDFTDCDIKNLSSKTFFECRNLIEIILPKNIEIIEEKVFVSTQIQEIHFPNPLTVIGNSSFLFCNNLSFVDLSNTKITVLGISLFGNCLNLTTIFLPFTLQIIPSSVCVLTSIKTLFFPPSISKLCFGAFSKNNELEEVDMSQANLTIIPPYAFTSCQKLRLIHLPEKVKTLTQSSFDKCLKLTHFIYCGTNVFGPEIKISTLRNVTVMGHYNFNNFFGVPVTFADDCPFLDIPRPDLEFTA